MVVLAVLGGGCVAAPTPAPAQTPSALLPSATAPPAVVSTPAAVTPTTVRLWLPPELMPGPETPGGQVLAEQLAAFTAARGIQVEVRAKAATGNGGLLASLLSAQAVAPGALPDVAALNMDDLTTAARAGALSTLDGLVPEQVLQDSYPFAQTLSRVDGRWSGAPFAIDAGVLVYDTDLYPTAPTRWTEVVTGTLVLAAADPHALPVLSAYLALDGPLTDELGRPALDVPKLTAALSGFGARQELGRLPLSTLDYADDAGTWQVFRERRAALALTSASWFLREAARVARAAATLPPTGTGQPFTLAEGWSWVIVDRDGDRTPAAELVAWLMTPERAAAWTLAARVLPAQSTVLAAWAADPAAPLAAAVLTRAQVRPTTAQLAVLGPALQEALEDVLRGRASPDQAARAVAQTYLNP